MPSSAPHPDKRGTMTLVSTALPAEQMTSNSSTDATIVSVKIGRGDQSINVHNLYLRPNITKKERPDLGKLMNDKNPTILAGDFNAKNELWTHKNDPIGNYIANEIFENRKFTVLNNGENTRKDFAIDLSIISNVLAATTKWYLDPFLASDHRAIIMELYNKHETQSIPHVPHRIMNKANWSMFQTQAKKVFM